MNCYRPLFVAIHKCCINDTTRAGNDSRSEHVKTHKASGVRYCNKTQRVQTPGEPESRYEDHDQSIRYAQFRGAKPTTSDQVY
jgi:hypothetical protein